VSQIIQPLNLTCETDYNLFDEERRSFEPGWINETAMVYSLSIRQAFMYQSGNQLGTYLYVGDHATYNSGGYVYEF
jgi:hypothetical protein